MSKPKFELNQNLLKTQKVSNEQEENLHKIYKELFNLQALTLVDEHLEKYGKDYTRRMKNIEFELQENWNFPKDELCHTWWNSFDDCVCPKMDNQERFGFPKIINSLCPFHRD